MKVNPQGRCHSTLVRSLWDQPVRRIGSMGEAGAQPAGVPDPLPEGVRPIPGVVGVGVCCMLFPRPDLWVPGLSSLRLLQPWLVVFLAGRTARFARVIRHWGVAPHHGPPQLARAAAPAPSEPVSSATDAETESSDSLSGPVRTRRGRAKSAPPFVFVVLCCWLFRIVLTAVPSRLPFRVAPARCSVPFGAFSSVPTVCMHEWIRTMIYRMLAWLDVLRWRLRPEYAGAETTDGMTLVKLIEWEDERVRVQRYDKACGHVGFLIEMDVYAHRDREWLTVANFGGENLESAIVMLKEALECVRTHSGARPLPTLQVFGKRFFLDEVLKELRNVDDPHDRVELHPIA